MSRARTSPCCALLFSLSAPFQLLRLFLWDLTHRWLLLPLPPPAIPRSMGRVEGMNWAATHSSTCVFQATYLQPSMLLGACRGSGQRLPEVMEGSSNDDNLHSSSHRCQTWGQHLPLCHRGASCSTPVHRGTLFRITDVHTHQAFAHENLTFVLAV